jgi:hypothetical protein
MGTDLGVLELDILITNEFTRPGELRRFALQSRAADSRVGGSEMTAMS